MELTGVHTLTAWSLLFRLHGVCLCGCCGGEGTHRTEAFGSEKTVKVLQEARDMKLARFLDFHVCGFVCSGKVIATGEELDGLENLEKFCRRPDCFCSFLQFLSRVRRASAAGLMSCICHKADGASYRPCVLHRFCTR